MNVVLVNAPQRTQDLEDILALLRGNRGRLDMEQVRGYIQLLNKAPSLMTSSANSSDAPLAGNVGMSVPVPECVGAYQALDDLMAAVEALCPVWPPRPEFERMVSSKLRL